MTGLPEGSEITSGTDAAALAAGSALDLSRYRKLAVYIGMGQSFIDGVGHGNLRETTQAIAPGRAVTTRTSGDLQNLLPDRAYSGLYDTGTGRGRETPLLQASAGILPALEPDEGLLTMNFGRGGFGYAKLRKTGSTAVYDNWLRAIDQQQRYAASAGLTLTRLFVSWVHGHADGKLSAAEYQANLLELLGDLAADFASRAPGAETLICLSQLACRAGGERFAVGLAQHHAAQAEPRILMACPEYPIARVDGTHMTGAGYALLGAYHGRAIRKTLQCGAKWQPLHMASAERIGASVRVRFAGGEGDLTFDAHRPDQGAVVMGVRPLADRGFTWVQSGGTEAAITGVALTGRREITIGLSADPGASACARLILGATPAGGSGQEGFVGGDPATATGGATNIRTIGTDTDAWGRVLHDWALLSEIEVV
ncbi:hypothetical protein [Frigidibacter albus]|nr:hypothetical protein [Frigidibacter albus]